MSTATRNTIRTEIAGLPVAELASQFGTPTYIYDFDIIAARINELRAFDVIRYAQKANSNLAVLDFMRKHGVVVDAVSAGEVHRALKAGYKTGQEPPEIVYTADIFDRSSLECVKQHQIPVNCGSPEMLAQLAEILPGQHVTLRINPGFGHGHSQKTNTGGQQSKHGIWHGDVEMCLQMADRLGLQISGLHMHIGSGTDFEHLSQVCDAMEKTALEVGRSITSISAGGGLPIPYRGNEEPVDIAKYFALWDATRKKLEAAFGHSVSLEIEPGRYLVAEAGYLLTEIRAVKQMGENLFYLVDAGFNNLARPILYGAYHPMSISHLQPEASTKQHAAIVGGPLCESGDIFTQAEGGFVESRNLPMAQVGDFLIIECAGAYGQVMASNYNSKPIAAEVAIVGGDTPTAHLIRERQSLDDLIRGETVLPS